MIYGIGTDIAAIHRFETLLAKHGQAFVAKILTEAEQADFVTKKQPAVFLAKRFAAKEAFAKAVGQGLRHPVTLHHVGVAHGPLGKPIYAYAPVLQDWLAERGITTVHLSISDERDNVVAFAIAEQR
ncbi:MAG: holo-ACP synthase [Neisseriaceae bacterium]|nr:holo-ACP synthase [Neisseriaceae bacterium]MBP6860996.1 holo-ACP synthase [Neisseriaceae bacterium]